MGAAFLPFLLIAVSIVCRGEEKHAAKPPPSRSSAIIIRPTTLKLDSTEPQPEKICGELHWSDERVGRALVVTNGMKRYLLRADDQKSARLIADEIGNDERLPLCIAVHKMSNEDELDISGLRLSPVTRTTADKQERFALAPLPTLLCGSFVSDATRAALPSLVTQDGRAFPILGHDDDFDHLRTHASDKTFCITPNFLSYKDYTPPGSNRTFPAIDFSHYRLTPAQEIDKTTAVLPKQVQWVARPKPVPPTPVTVNHEDSILELKKGTVIRLKTPITLFDEDRSRIARAKHSKGDEVWIFCNHLSEKVHLETIRIDSVDANTIDGNGKSMFGHIHFHLDNGIECHMGASIAGIYKEGLGAGYIWRPMKIGELQKYFHIDGVKESPEKPKESPEKPVEKRRIVCRLEMRIHSYRGRYSRIIGLGDYLENQGSQATDLEEEADDAISAARAVCNRCTPRDLPANIAGGRDYSSVSCSLTVCFDKATGARENLLRTQRHLLPRSCR